jgi:hypothetical protein
MSPRRALLILSCVTVCVTPLIAQSGSPGSSTNKVESRGSKVAGRGSKVGSRSNKVGSRGLSQPAGTTKNTKPRAAAPAKGADCDVVEVPVKAPPAPIPPTADLLSPTMTPCPPGQPAAAKP